VDQPVDVPKLLGEYHAVLLETHANRTELGGRSGKWNRLAHRLPALQLELRETQAGRTGISDFAVTDSCSTVRTWAASHALFWDEQRVRPVLEAQIAAGSMQSFEAKIVLREYDASRLNMTWTPKKH
jgi:hypothetical protein